MICKKSITKNKKGETFLATLPNDNRLMRKIQLIEAGIIATALIMGYKMITSLLTLITSLLFGFGTMGQNLLFAILPTVLFFAFYTITFFLLARNVKPLARFICREDDALLDLKLNKASVLHVIIVAVCLSSMLQTIPTLLEYSINKFIAPAEYGENFEPGEWRRNSVTFWNALFGLIISIILLLTSKNIASFFGKEEQSFEIGGEKIESNI